MMRHFISIAISAIRQLWLTGNGETNYQRYLLHWQQEHALSAEKPMDRKAFFAAETQRKWNGVKRCC